MNRSAPADPAREIPLAGTGKHVGASAPRGLAPTAREAASSQEDAAEASRLYPGLEDDLKKLFLCLKKKTLPENRQTADRTGKDGPGENLGVLGDFRVLREIGAGGMAAVYEAEQISLQRRVALKVLPTHLGYSSSTVKKFKREAEACARLRHPDIVTIHAVGQDNGAHYIAQELVEGGYTLTHRLEEFRTQKELPVGYFLEAADLIASVARALDYSHGSGVIHRDVKPSNILLTPDGQPKLTDFGLARVEGALALSRTGDFSGTPYYMSPEQAMCRRMGIDHRTDIYSLGVTLYETITLKRPFEGETSHEVLKKVVFQEPRDPQKENPRIPRDLSVICLKAMEKDPNRRYQTMDEFANDLDCFLNGEVIRARPTGPVRKLWKRVRRNPVLSIVIGIALFLLAAVILLSIIAFPIIFRKYLNVVDEKAEATLNWEMALEDRDLVECQRDRISDVLINTVDRKHSYTQPASTPPLNFRGVPDPVPATSEADGAGQGTALPAMYDRILALHTQIYGKDGPRTLHVRDRMAAWLAEHDFNEEAADFYRQNLAAYRQSLGEEHPETLAAMNNLACVYNELCETAKAGEFWERSIEIAERVLPPQRPVRLILRLNYGKFLRETGRFDDMKKILDACEEDLSAYSGDRDLNTSDSVFHLIDPLGDQWKPIAPPQPKSHEDRK